MIRPDGLSRLIRALAKRAGARPVVENVRSVPWSSITFDGTRHCFSLHFNGDQAADHLHALCDGLDYAEFDLFTHILVDIAIIEKRTDSGRGTARIEALIIDND